MKMSTFPIFTSGVLNLCGGWMGSAVQDLVLNVFVGSFFNVASLKVSQKQSSLLERPMTLIKMFYVDNIKSK